MRSILALAGLVVYTLILGIIVIIIGIFSRGNAFQYFLSRLWSKLVLVTAGVRVNVRGIENIPLNSSFVFMSNHQSHFDVISLISTIPDRIYFLAKKELMRIPVFGWAMYLMGHITIDRSDREEAFKSIDKAVEKVKKGINVLVFPEGTRSPTGDLLPFKKGGFVLAIKGGIPIIPIGIYGSNRILPKGSIKINPGTISIAVGKPIETLGFNLENKERLMERVREEITRLREEAKLNLR
ncbi:MAG: lysophospholipid acyltransferase family protein [candidate division WOR-3 bacterium]